MPSRRVVHSAQITARQRMHTPTPARSRWYLHTATLAAPSVQDTEAIQTFAQFGLQLSEPPARTPYADNVCAGAPVLLACPHEIAQRLPRHAQINPHLDNF